MSVDRLALPAAWATRLAPLRVRWLALAPRERKAVAIALTVVALFLVWAVAVAPAWRIVRSAPAELDRLDVQLQQMQRLAAESRDLRATPPVVPMQARAALEAATSRLGSKGKLSLVSDRATLTFTGVEGPLLRDWLAEARSGARARPIEAQFTRGPQGYTGSITLSLSGAGIDS